MHFWHFIPPQFLPFSSWGRGVFQSLVCQVLIISILIMKRMLISSPLLFRREQPHWPILTGLSVSGLFHPGKQLSAFCSWAHPQALQGSGTVSSPCSTGDQVLSTVGTEVLLNKSLFTSLSQMFPAEEQNQILTCLSRPLPQNMPPACHLA